MRVFWTELARSQLEGAMAYIARDRPATATRWLDKLLAAADSLAELPDRGRMVEEAQREDVRELIVGPYRLIYRRDVDAVYITMVRHGRQHLDAEDVE